MANQKKSRHENIPAAFYVDETCIDCGTCYWMAPQTFKEVHGKSAVYQHSEDERDLKQSFLALLSCPTTSIGVSNNSLIHSQWQNDLPRLIDENVWHTGYHSEKSFGAASYFITHEHGGLLIDSPRKNKKLVNQFQEWGGLKYQLHTHKDDIADADYYHQQFHSQRFIHHYDVNQYSAHFELIEKRESPFEIFPDFWVIPVPGHTRGHVVFLYKNKYLFTGDHLCYSLKKDRLIAFRNACWYDFSVQIESMKILLNFDFEYILPGHGAPCYFPVALMQQKLKQCLDWMYSVA